MSHIHNPEVVVFLKPRRGRFKACILWETSRRRLRRIAVPDQPFHGFATSREAFRFAAGQSAPDLAADVASALCGGQRDPP